MGEVTGALADLNLAHNAFYRQFPDRIPLTDEAKGLANLQGSGMVRDLREAASLDGGPPAHSRGAAPRTPIDTDSRRASPPTQNARKRSIRFRRPVFLPTAQAKRRRPNKRRRPKTATPP